MTTDGIAVDQSLPVGTVLAYVGLLPKDLVSRGWLVCDGSSRLARDYRELFGAISFNFGARSTDEPEFNLPDLRGRFIRSTAPDAAKRAQRDPEWAERGYLYAHGAVKEHVGSYQGYGTAKPRNPFSTRVGNLDIVSANDAAGCGANPASYHSGSVDLKLSGGDVETRPANKYLYFIIKAFSTKDGQPVLPPVGAVIPFAGPSQPAPPPPEQWDRCAGQSVAREGKYFRLYEAIGISQGSDGTKFRLPDYRGWFLRGVSEAANTDPNRDTRVAPSPGGNAGNNVGSQQDWATGLPYETGRQVQTTFSALPTQNRGKYVDTLGRELARVNHGSVPLQLSLGQSGDAETRPENISIDFYVKSQPEGEVPVGTIAAIGVNLPANDFWLPCDGRSLAIAEYQDLHKAIGTTYGSEPGRFRLPDTEGRFLRGASDTTGQDPDAARRIPAGSGEPAGVGSVQGFATGRPRTEFSVNVPNLPNSTIRTHGGARGGVAGINGPKDIDPWSKGGNADTRPVNVYLNCYIRAR